MQQVPVAYHGLKVVKNSTGILEIFQNACVCFSKMPGGLLCSVKRGPLPTLKNLRVFTKWKKSF
jgi:hypothetical protein